MLDCISNAKGHAEIVSETNMKIANSFEINLDALNEIALELRHASTSEEALMLFNAKYNLSIDILGVLRYMAILYNIYHDVVNENTASSQYRRDSMTGRFYLRGRTLNMQNIPSVLRKALFSKQGYYDVDAETCHVSICLGRMEKEHGIDVDKEYQMLSLYKRDKNTIRSEIAKRHNMTIAQAKTLLAAIPYGAKLIIGHKLEKVLFSAMSRNEMRTRFEKLRNDPIVSAITREFADIKKRTVAAAKVKASKRNQVKLPHGKKLSTLLYSETKLFAYINMSEESIMLKKIVEVLGDKIVVLQHDGFTVREDIDVVELQRTIKGTLGYDITFKKTLL